MGTGKTKLLMQYIMDYIINNPNKSICILSFRLTFTKEYK